jgi:FlaA1/EpsC-like NDP-sugar epimerase
MTGRPARIGGVFRESWRRSLLFLLDLLLVVGSYIASYFIRFDGVPPPHYRNLMLVMLPLIVLLRAGTMVYFKLDRGIWRYAGIKDLNQILKAVTVSSVLIVALAMGLYSGHPRSIFIIDWLLLIVGLSGARFAIRLTRPFWGRRREGEEPRRRVLIVGAGDAGEMILREMMVRGGLDYDVVGMVDDNPSKQGRRIHGIPVVGRSIDIPSLVERRHVQEVIIAIPSLTPEQTRAIVEYCMASRARYRILPNLADLINGTVQVKDLREVKLEDLLQREEVVLSREKIGDYLAGQTVLITGAGGSIGSELCRQVARYAPGELVLFEKAENSLFYIDMELGQYFRNLSPTSVIGDVRDRRRVREILSRHRPRIIFHAAAHKHVPLMETNPLEAVKNNTFGTRVVAEEAVRAGVERFLFLSTDKAVDPASVMGASKRLAEMYIMALAGEGRTRFMAVRFGNVLGSEGSIIPIFQKQIEKRGPITVTHPEIKRYFMTIPEAVGLVLEVGAMGRGGEIFILEMGRQIKVVDLARDLIKLSGLEPDRDIELTFTGLRPGEKMCEKLVGEEEQVRPTGHEKVMVLAPPASAGDTILSDLQALEEIVEREDVVALLEKVAQIIPTYRPSQKVMEIARNRKGRWSSQES